MSKTLPIPSCVAAIALACCVSACCVSASAAETVEHTVPADAHGEVSIVNIAGEIHVLGWDRKEVQIRGEVGRGQRLDVQTSNRRTSINVVRVSGRSSGAAELTIHVPRDSTLSTNTISADQTIQDLRGVQRLQAVSGSITTEQWSEDLEAKTISGQVAIRCHGGNAEAAVNTVSGEITLIDAPAELAIETVTGDMKISVGALSRGRIRTTNGELRLTGKLAPQARLDVEAINGDLYFKLREPLNAQFDVETFNGDIDNCFGPKPVRTREFAPGNALRFTQGKGDARVRIKTLNGGVEICKD
jgi:DUF4097 and DUF4098 domain-containing protein YvlB